MVTKIINVIVITLLIFCALYLTGLGGVLVYFGGSLYYLFSGLVLSAVLFFWFKRNALAHKIFGAFFLLTVVWAVWESGLDFFALLPRLAFWLGLGLWFLFPLSSKRYRNSARSFGQKRWYFAPASASIVVLTIAALQSYEFNGPGTTRTAKSTSIPYNTGTNWLHYGNDAGGSRFAPVEQIDSDNVHKLKEVWRYRTGVESDFKMTPLKVDDSLYLCGAKNVLISLNAETGEETWRYDPEAVPSATHQYARTCRGISYFKAPDTYIGECPERIVTATIDARMIAVDAHSGKLCKSFGNNGEINLRKGLGEHLPNQYYVTSPPLVAGDVLVVGGLVNDNQDLGLPSGVVRAFDAISGQFSWAWDLGNPGYYGEPKEGETYTKGTPNVWTIMSYDPQLDLVFAPTGNAAPDYYGGVRRPFDDEWSSSLVAIDASNGHPKWKFQTVYHDVWDYDLPAQPVLVDVEKEGENVPAVAVPTKMGSIFLLDRRTGKPVHPVEERPVAQYGEATERLSPVQPFSSLPNFHPYRHEKDMWGLTPLDQLVCRIEYKMMKYDGLFTPPTTGGSMAAPGNFGGFNWGSVSVDADNGLLVAAPMLLAHRLLLVSPEQVAEAGPRAALLLGKEHPAVRMDPESPMPEKREPNPADPFDHVRIKYYGLIMPFMSRLGTKVPCFEPPWSKLAVIDLNTNELMWSRPLGSMKNSGPFNIQSGLEINVGTAVRAGTLTTRGGLTFISSTMDSTVRAFDLRTGEIKWSDSLPGNGQATPMTYISRESGRQVLIVTVPNPSWRYPRDPKGGTYTDSRSKSDGKGGYVIAYALY